MLSDSAKKGIWKRVDVGLDLIGCSPDGGEITIRLSGNPQRITVHTKPLYTAEVDAVDCN